VTESANRIETAQQLLRSGRNTEAIVTLGSIQMDDAQYWYAQRLVADAHFQNREWGKALENVERMLGRGCGTPYDLLFRSRVLANIGRYQDSILQLEALTRAVGETIESDNLFKICYYNMGESKKAIKYGQAAIQGRDREVSDRLREIDIIRNPAGKDVISFSLWGARDIYCLGAVINARICRYVYPSWVARFYVGRDVPESVIRALAFANAEIIHAETEFPSFPSYFWRFIVANDPSVRRFMCRDTDSRVTSREAVLVRDWIDSNRSFHVIRDHVLHNDLMLAGMWGGHSSPSLSLPQLMASYFNGTVTNKYGHDQRFLAREIWPRIKGSVYVNDPHYRTPPVRSVRHHHVFGSGHIGEGYQDEVLVRKEANRLEGDGS